ncbi:hypothetical protein K9U33_03035 [Rhodoblastus acidophilus]|uniref:Uncharacterized protein n=1 Tax=Candidatus Rhodoblastus alkanivorans TaxID=2954117 RepID=A0ABS9Z4S8_9HYPH|nr:hypothetical protein [Candidatus Rhodoblastus alkanivorans]MCI4677630.1 hypothetical protein [Candidatus Rhodoblastus alkanivorans]MCI4682638.1 hypothetical protein [Candidatus Rhodoblastus alkanivorans]
MNELDLIAVGSHQIGVKRREPAYARLFHDDERRISIFVLDDARNLAPISAAGHERRVGEVERAPIVPTAPEIGKHFIVKRDESFGLPMAGLIAEAGPQHMRRKFCAKKADHACESARAGTVHAEDQDTHAVRRRAYPFYRRRRLRRQGPAWCAHIFVRLARFRDFGKNQSFSLPAR